MASPVSQFAIKPITNPGAICKNDQYLLKVRTVKIERDEFAFEKSPFNVTEKNLNLKSDLLEGNNDMTFNAKNSDDRDFLRCFSAQMGLNPYLRNNSTRENLLYLI